MQSRILAVNPSPARAPDLANRRWLDPLGLQPDLQERDRISLAPADPADLSMGGIVNPGTVNPADFKPGRMMLDKAGN